MLHLTLPELAKITQTELQKDTSAVITRPCSLEDAAQGGVCYLVNIDKPEEIEKLSCSALIVPESAKEKNVPFKGALLYAKNPEWAFVLLLRYVDSLETKHTPGIHPTAVISPSAKLGANVSVGAYSVIEDNATIGDGTVIFPQCYIGKNVTIGKNCYIYPQVVIREHCILKDFVILQAGARIGSDGFGFTFYNGRHQKIPQVGNVVIGNDVEIQSNTCIDRAKISSTTIGDNTKIDNLVQVGHNVRVGMSDIFCSQVGIAGTTEIGNGVILAGQVGLAGHMKVGDRAQIGAQSGAMGTVPAGATYLGTPAMPQRDFLKQQAVLRKVPELYKEFRDFQKMSFFQKLKKFVGL